MLRADKLVIAVGVAMLLMLGSMIHSQNKSFEQLQLRIDAHNQFFGGR